MSVHIKLWIIIYFLLEKFGSLFFSHLFLSEVERCLNLLHLDWTIHTILFLKYTWQVFATTVVFTSLHFSYFKIIDIFYIFYIYENWKMHKNLNRFSFFPIKKSTPVLLCYCLKHLLPFLHFLQLYFPDVLFMLDFILVFEFPLLA